MILQLWNWICDFGVSSSSPEEHELIRLYNGMSFLSGIGILCVTVSAYLIDFSPTYVLVTLFIFLEYVAILLLNFFGKIQAARYFVSIGSVVWVAVSYVFVGGYFCQGVAVIATMAITYVGFQGQPAVRIRLFVFQIVLFFLSIVYVNFFGPIFGVIDFPYDEIMVCLGGVGWGIILLHKLNRDQSNLVSSLKENNQELQSTTEELERFTYIASHDLKSPIRTIISFTGLVERDLKNENYENIPKNLSYIRTGAEQMYFLVQDILELSRLKESLQSERPITDLNVVYEKAKQNLKEEISEKNAILTCGRLPHFPANELEFILIFQNIIQNGIKYNESPRPSVRISSQEGNQFLTIRFEDNGIGIEKKYHDQIFQFFKRLHTPIEYQGTGLGLGLCKKIVTDYGGKIEVESNEGSGTVFTIVLPKPQEADQSELMAGHLESSSKDLRHAHQNQHTARSRRS